MVLQKTLGLAKCLSNFTCGTVPFSVFIYLFIYLFIYGFSRHLILNFSIHNLQISENTLILTCSRLSELHKKLKKTYLNIRFGAKKTQLFCSKIS